MDRYYTKKVLSILHSNDIEAKGHLKQIIEMLHVYLQSNNGPDKEISDKVISYKEAVHLNDNPDPHSLP